jgi:hypothetical protein
METKVTGMARCISLPFSRESFAKDKNAGGHALG